MYITVQQVYQIVTCIYIYTVYSVDIGLDAVHATKSIHSSLSDIAVIVV